MNKNRCFPKLDADHTERRFWVFLQRDPMQEILLILGESRIRQSYAKTKAKTVIRSLQKGSPAYIKGEGKLLLGMSGNFQGGQRSLCKGILLYQKTLSPADNLTTDLLSAPSLGKSQNGCQESGRGGGWN